MKKDIPIRERPVILSAEYKLIKGIKSNAEKRK